MWHIRKIDPAKNVLTKKYITFVGAGGKSSLIGYLAAQAAGRDKRTAITTTTRIYAQEPFALLAGNTVKDAVSANPIRIGKSCDKGKLTSVGFDDVLAMGERFDTILIEADGAKGKPLKYPALYEPVIPPFSEIIFVVAGLDGLYQPLRDQVFRWEMLKEKA